MSNITLSDDDDILILEDRPHGNSYTQNRQPSYTPNSQRVSHSPSPTTTPVIRNAILEPTSGPSDDNLRFVSGFWAIVGGAPQVIRRSYTTHLDGDVHDRLYADIDPNAGFSKNNISSITGALVSQASEDYTLIDLPNGINSQRIIFMLQFSRYSSVTGKTNLFYVNGYTDKVDVSMMSNLMAPDTRFYINEIVEIATGYRYDSYGNKRPFQELRSCDQIISGGFDPRNYLMADHSIRPMDLFQSAREQEALCRHNLSSEYNVSDSFIFTSSNKFKKSSRINNNPIDYVGRSLKALDAAAGDRFVTDPDSLYESATERLTETSITNDAILGKLQRRCDIRREGFVELSVLLSAFPEMNDPRLFKNATAPRSAPTVIDSADLTSRAYEIAIGKMLATSISAVAMKHYLTNLRIAVTPLPTNPVYGMNREYWEVVLYDIKGYLPAEFVMTKFEDFKRELVETVLPSIIQDPDNIGIEFELAMNILDKTHIELRINGGEWYPQVYANFCDGIAAPVVSSGADNLAAISNDLITIYNDFYGNHRFK